MEIAKVHKLSADAYTIAVGKQHIIRQNNGTAGVSVCFQTAVDHLQEVQLFVGGLERDIVTGCALAAFFGSERRVGQDHVKAVQPFCARGQGVFTENMRRNIVQIGVHQSQTVRIVHQLNPIERVLKRRHFLIRKRIEIHTVNSVLIGGNHKTKSTAGGVKAFFTEFRGNQIGHHINEHTGREILPSAGLFSSAFFCSKPS